MRSSLFLLSLATALILGGCGEGGGTTAAEEAAFKNADKNAIKPPPPGANSAPSDFKSSLDGAGSAKPPGAG